MRYNTKSGLGVVIVFAAVAELADAQVSKTCGGAPTMWVRFPPAALEKMGSPYTRAKLGIGRHAPCCALVHGDSHPRHRIFRGR